jgi:hypothetical protein
MAEWHAKIEIIVEADNRKLAWVKAREVANKVDGAVHSVGLEE